jgi:hypothetical protein
VLCVQHLSQPILDQHLRSAYKKHSQPHIFQQPRHRQKLHDKLCVIATITLIKSVDYQHKNSWALQLRQRLKDKVLPLVTQQLAGNLRTLEESITNIVPDARHAPCKLDRNASNKHACLANITAASREEKASTQTLLCIIPAGDQACDCCFASASQAAQPENVLLTLPVCPFIYSFQEINTGVSKARCVVLRGIQVKRRVLGVQKAGNKVLYSHTMSVKRPALLQPKS